MSRNVFVSSRFATALQFTKLGSHQTQLARSRQISTLTTNPHIYVHDDTSSPNKSYILSLLSKSPPNASLAIGSTTELPPTPESFQSNKDFLEVVHEVIAEHAAQDPEMKAQAATYASQSGSSLGSGGAFFPHQQHRLNHRKEQRLAGGGGGSGGDGAGGASAQGGMGGAGRGGYIHVSDQRNPPDFGRVSWPEDIFGSLELDGQGNFVDGTGRYQRAGTYRVVTREGILGLSSFLREKLVQRLKELENQLDKVGSQ